MIIASAASNTVGGWLLHPGGDFLPPPARGGDAYAYIFRAVPVLSCGNWYHWLVSASKKEVTAPAPNCAVTSRN